MRAQELLVREFRTADTDAVVALWERCELTRPWNDPLKDIERKLATEAGPFLVGEIDGRIVGSAMAGWDGHRGWVNYLAVDPAARGRGHGAALMAAAEAALRDLGCPKINVQIRIGNEAIGFYRHLGFTENDVVSLGKRLEVDGLR